MKTFLIAMLAVFAALNAWADGTPSPPATQTEVNAGVIHNKFVAPDTLKAALNGSTATNVTTTLRKIRMPLITAAMAGTGVYGPNNGPPPWYPLDWVSAPNNGVLGAYCPDLNTTTNTRARCTVTILNTNTVPLPMNLRGAILYYGSDMRAYLNPEAYALTNLAQGYTTLTWTNTYTNVTLVRAIGFEERGTGATQNIFTTEFTTQPLP